MALANINKQFASATTLYQRDFYLLDTAHQSVPAVNPLCKSISIKPL